MKIFILFYLLISTGCTISNKKINITNDVELLMQIHIGESSDSVRSKLGSPQSEWSGGADDFEWHYKNENKGKSFKSTIEFSKKNNKVQTIIVFPGEDEKESDLNYLLNTKFKNLKFEKFKKTTCKHSSYLSREYYINKSEGLFIQYAVWPKFVKYYSYRSLQEIEQFIQIFNACKLGFH